MQFGIIKKHKKYILVKLLNQARFEFFIARTKLERKPVWRTSFTENKLTQKKLGQGRLKRKFVFLK